MRAAEAPVAPGCILILGGYGGFGGRLSRRLAGRGHEIWVAGRRLAAARAFCRDVIGCRPVEADRTGDIAAVLAHCRPRLVIDAAGPFQDSGYDVPRACLAARTAYLDLADARAFVSGFAALDGQAKAAGVALLSGASSIPALSGAVVRHLTDGLAHAAAIEMSISASNRAAAGSSVAAAILSAVGQPSKVWRGDRQATVHGWQEPRRETFAVPGHRPLRGRWTALGDAPDLDLLPDRVAGRPAVTFRAGTELAFQNLALWAASWPVRWGWLRSLRPLAGALLPLQGLTRRLGTDRSAMRVRVFGAADGRRVERRWTLLAERGDGPEIPTLAATLLAEALLEGNVARGARDAGEALRLSDFAPLFATLAVAEHTEEIVQAEPLYERIMGAAFGSLPPAVRTVHGVLRDAGAAGRATVSDGSHPLAGLVCAIMGFPAPGAHRLHVAFAERDGVERWVRDFSGRRFASEMSRSGGRIVERFGPFRFQFDLVGDARGLNMAMRRWSCAGLPLPLALAPRSQAREWEEDGLFRFDVSINYPLIGRIVRYQGWLDPVGDRRQKDVIDDASSSDCRINEACDV